MESFQGKLIAASAHSVFELTSDLDKRLLILEPLFVEGLVSSSLPNFLALMQKAIILLNLNSTAAHFRASALLFDAYWNQVFCPSASESAIFRSFV